MSRPAAPVITIRAPPHRDYLTGFPGIPAYSPSSLTAPHDLLLPSLSQQPLRPQACLSGSVEIRPGKAGVKAKWLRLELEKTESIPAPPSSPGGGGGKEGGGGGGGGGSSGASTRVEGRMVELIGSGPGILWDASASKKEDGGAAEGAERAPTPNSSPNKTGSTKGRFGKGFKKLAQSGNHEEEEEGWDFIPEGNYPFRIPIPEGLPPSTYVDSKSNGISYALVATLCVKGKKGLLKTSTKTMPLISSSPVTLIKDDILPTWPVYSPLLPLPLPPKLPWFSPDVPTVGEVKESKLALRAGNSGEVWMKAIRESGAFGPGDPIQVRVQVGWGGDSAIKLTRLDFVLRETLSFRYPPVDGVAFRAPPRITSIFTANASVSSDPDNPAAFAVLYPHEPVSFNLTGIIPGSHTRVTVRTAKHIDVMYHLKIRAMIEGGEECAIDHWAVIVGHVGVRESKGRMIEIGWVDELCDRKGSDSADHATFKTPPPVAAAPLAPAPTSTPARAAQEESETLVVRRDRRNSISPLAAATIPAVRTPEQAYPDRSTPTRPEPARFAPSPVVAASPPPAHPQANGSNSPYFTAEQEKARLYGAATSSSRPTATSRPQQGYRVANPSPDLQPHVAAPTPIRPEYSPSRTPRAGEPLSPQPFTNVEPSPIPIAQPRYDRDDHVAQPQPQTEEAFSPVSRGSRNSTMTFDSRHSTAEDEKARLHHAAVIRRSVIQSGLSKPPEQRTREEQVALDQLLNASGTTEVVEEAPLVARGQLAPVQRSNTTIAFSGSSVSMIDEELVVAPPIASRQQQRIQNHQQQQQQQQRLHSPEILPYLSRTKTMLSSAEQEKKRLFEEAKETARRRQEEARIELERQNAVMARLEVEEQERAVREEELEREYEEEERRRMEDAITARERFEEEEREKMRREEEQWVREEEARRREAREKFERQRREAEERRVEQLQRLAELQREGEEGRKSEMLRIRRERDRIEEEQERQRIEEERRAKEEAEERARQEAEAKARQQEYERKAAAQRQQYELQAPRPQPAPARAYASQPPPQQQQQRSDFGPAHNYAPPRQPVTPVPGYSSSGQAQPQALYRQPEPVRAPSTASFAPTTTNVNEATAEYYAAAIANTTGSLSRNPTLSQQKDAYVASLRQRAGMPASPAPYATPPSSRIYGGAPLASPPEIIAPAPLPTQDHSANYEQPRNQFYAGYHQASYPQQSPERSHQLQRQPSREYQPQQDPYSPISPQQRYEEEPQHQFPPTEPLRIRMSNPPGSQPYEQGNHAPVEHQASPYTPQTPYSGFSEGSLQDTSRPYYANPPSSFDPPRSPRARPLTQAFGSPPVDAPSSLPGMAPATDPHAHQAARNEAPTVVTSNGNSARGALSPEEDGLPQYPAGATASRGHMTAAEEKNAVQRYQAAKDAVDAFTTQHPTQPDVSVQQPLHAIHEQHPTSHLTPSAPGNASPSLPPPSALRPQHRHGEDAASEGSSELHRDPAISAGKRPALNSSTSSSTHPSAPATNGNGHGLYESADEAYAQHRQQLFENREGYATADAPQIPLSEDLGQQGLQIEFPSTSAAM